MLGVRRTNVTVVAHTLSVLRKRPARGGIKKVLSQQPLRIVRVSRNLRAYQAATAMLRQASDAQMNAAATPLLSFRSKRAPWRSNPGALFRSSLCAALTTH